MTIKVKYFATIRELVGKSEELIELDASTPSELFSFLKEKYSFEFEESNLKVAINNEYANFAQTWVSDSILLFLFPPWQEGFCFFKRKILF